ncbi:MAG TPA: hypothetical protein VMH35_23370 [Streptosporangiaceae bacterium]|nr:hypothetical protein [Streptosporangiaceae bacterium]
MAADGAGQAETYLRLLAEAELRRAPVLHGPGSQPHRVSLAATALASAGALTLDTAWQVVADFQAACALRQGDPAPALTSLRFRGWPAGPPASLTLSSGPPAIRHSVIQFLASSYRPGWARPTAASGPPAAPAAIPIGATLPLPAERDGWYGEHHLLALTRTGTEAAITVATRWAGQTRRSAGPRPRHAPFHQVGAVDDRGVRYQAALWDMGIEDGREWWDCHLALTPAPPDGTRWLDIGPGARGRCIRVELAQPDLVTGAGPQPAAPDGSPAARLLDRAGDELLARGPGRRVAGLTLASRVGLLITDLTESGALAAGDPAVGRLIGLGWRLGMDLGLPPDGRIPRATLPETWRSMLACGDAGDGPVGVAAFAANLPEICGARFSLAGLRSASDGATLHVMASGWTPHGSGWLAHGLRSHSDPSHVTLTWQARDSAGRWHLVTGMHWGSREGMIQMQLAPPLHPGATSVEVIVTGGGRQARATVPLCWLPGGPDR